MDATVVDFSARLAALRQRVATADVADAQEALLELRGELKALNLMMQLFALPPQSHIEFDATLDRIRADLNEIAIGIGRAGKDDLGV